MTPVQLKLDLLCAGTGLSAGVAKVSLTQSLEDRSVWLEKIYHLKKWNEISSNQCIICDFIFLIIDSIKCKTFILALIFYSLKPVVSSDIYDIKLL